METTLSLSLLLTMLFGVIELSMVLFQYNSVSEAARRGTRYAIVRGSTYTGVTCTGASPSDCDATAANIEAYVASLGYSGISAGNVTVGWCAPPSNGTVTLPCTGGTNSPGNMVQVTVSTPAHIVLPMVSSKAVTLSSTSQMVISQ